ncbi:Cohesin loading complex subunit SCC4-like protein [Aphelenchoides fujianensis]|nr:Cohesin loading complex subunit SCC4-like protein [Aphelenchoides fujianensis]
MEQQAEVIPIPPTVNPDDAVLRLMATAESFPSAPTAQAARKIPCSPELSARLSFELGKMLYFYSKNTRLARLHLELAAICLIGDIYIEERRYEPLRGILRGEIEPSKQHPDFHAKILFLYSDLYIKLKDFDKALEVVKQAIAYFTRLEKTVIVCYFLLIKCLVYSIQSGLCQTELGASVTELSDLLNGFPAHVPALEDIRAFCYSVQLSFFLSAGFFKNSKLCLRQLHVTVQLASKKEADPNPHFRWLSSEMLTAIAYVLTVLCNIQFNNLDRAHRYFQTSIKHFESLRQVWHRSSWPIIERRHEELADRLEILVYEAIAPTFLVVARPEDCLSHILQMRELISKSPLLLQDFKPQIHCLLAMYSTYFRNYEDAELQYNLSAEFATDMELQLFSYLSLAVMHLCAGKTMDFYETYEKITPLQTHAKNMRALVLFVNALHTYVHNRVDECKNYIAQSLNISRDEDIGRLQALSSLLLSTLLKAKDEDALTTGISWAQKLGDLSLPAVGREAEDRVLQTAGRKAESGGGGGRAGGPPDEAEGPAGITPSPCPTINSSRRASLWRRNTPELSLFHPLIACRSFIEISA